MAGEVRISVRRLVEFVLRCGSIDSRFSGFDRAMEGSRIHRKLQKDGGSNYEAEVFLRASRVVNDIHFTLEGRADGVLTEDSTVTIDEIKTTTAATELLTEDFNPLHWAQAICYGAMLCERDSLPALDIRLTYYQVDTEEIIRHHRHYTRTELEDFLQDTLQRYCKWAGMMQQHRAARNSSLKEAAFPFREYREGQYRLAGAVYRTIASKGQLLASAPTGIGKTISTLFPSLKAMGEEKAERIFYLTAKTSTRQAAESAMETLRATNLNMQVRSITLTAKDKVCFLDERECTPEACPYANGYYDRLNDALYTFLETQSAYTRDAICAFAKEHTLCPFELALDVSEWCDVVICDYNYLFDPVVHLQRFFEEETDCGVFLVDEAHNLVDRARDMYSASLSKSAFYEVKKMLGKSARPVTNSLQKINNYFIELRHKCEETEEHHLVQKKLPEDFVNLLMRFSGVCEKWLNENRTNPQHTAVLQLYFDTRFFVRIAQLYDENFATLIFARSNEVTTQLRCLHPAPFLHDSLSLGTASILFSATLSPLPYYRHVLGLGEEAKQIVLQSPFEEAHLCLLCADGISTKYADRATTLPQVCEMIAACVKARSGNYIVYFPSYRYLQMAAEKFAETYPDIPLSLQQGGMTDVQREEFLAQFAADSGETLVGFCVLGGAFSEGIDLAGNRLIGSIVVGVGLPQIGTEQNLLRDYYEETLQAGFDYAYRYPGMNKVLQAGGRVIRTASDMGVVLLIDSRYAQSSYRCLLPPHWQHCRSVHTLPQMTEILADFWQEK